MFSSWIFLHICFLTILIMVTEQLYWRKFFCGCSRFMWLWPLISIMKRCAERCALHLYHTSLKKKRSHIGEPAYLTGPAHLHWNCAYSVVEENEKRCICLHLPSSDGMVCCDVCDTWYHMECIELDHTFTHNTAVYVYHLCIKNTFSDILQYLRYIIKCFLNNNSGDPVGAL